tara:strand:- start:43856 stop:45337 length:1482 start_codon:yes stop_codon:yes gene_type:complete
MFLLVFTSCSSLKSQNKDTNKTSDVTKLSEMSESRAKAIEAAQIAESDNDASRIIGSSQIFADQPTDHATKTYFLYGAEHLNLENYYFDIPVVYNAAVKKWINYFLNRGRGFFERYGARAGRYAPILGNILEEHGLPRDLIFLAMAESGFQNKAKSWAKAVGPWQFMPFTGKRFGLHIDWYVDERRDPIKATIAASKYLKILHDEFGSWELAAAGYNAGENKVSRAIKRYGTENFWRLRKGRYLRSETKNYVPKIMALAIIGKNLKSFGFEGIDFHEPLDFEEISVGPATDLYKVAQELDVDFEEVQRLNPEVLRWFTPPTVKNYLLRVPVGRKVVWQNCCTNKELLADNFQNYKVRGSRSRLSDVARKFKIKDKNVLAWLNNKDHRTRLKRGEIVVLPFKDGQNIKANMYADLYERPRKSVVRRRKYRRQIKKALRRGRKISNPKVFYTVKKGDSLWTVSRKNGISLNSLIASNYHLIKRRRIRAGDKLAVR